jgi:hypothetical protein
MRAHAANWVSVNMQGKRRYRSMITSQRLACRLAMQSGPVAHWNNFLMAALHPASAGFTISPATSSKSHGGGSSGTYAARSSPLTIADRLAFPASMLCLPGLGRRFRPTTAARRLPGRQLTWPAALAGGVPLTNVPLGAK